MRSSVPALSSTISSAIRRSARSTARASRTVDCLGGMTAEYVRAGRVMQAALLIRFARRLSQRLQFVPLWHERYFWFPHPFVVADEELRFVVHARQKANLH